MYLEEISAFNTLYASSHRAKPTEQPMSPFCAVPADLLIEIASLLDSREDVLNFCLTVRKVTCSSSGDLIDALGQSTNVFANVSTVLYERVCLKSANQCTVTLGMLCRRPDIARHVRELVYQPHGRSASSGEEAASAVIKAASSKHLDALVRFQWDDEELPYQDDMWFALRMW